MLPLADRPKSRLAEELIVALLVRKLPKLDRQEFHKMFKLADVRKSRVWQEAHEEGVEEGLEKGGLLKQQEYVRRWISEGKELKEIADLLGIPVAKVRRLAKPGEAYRKRKTR